MEKTTGIEFPYAKDNKERLPWEHYLSEFEQADPQEIAQRLQIAYDQEAKSFQVTLLGTVYSVTWPDFQVTHKEDSVGYYPLEDTVSAKILVIRYLLYGLVFPNGGEFYTYREMPSGDLYDRQFNGRCILRLAYGFGSKIDRFRLVMERMGGKKLEFGDASYEVRLTEDYYVRFILWEGDDEFPPSSQILFSDNFPNAFEAEDRTVVAEVCIGMMKALDKCIGS
ncbi:MAG: DUF3786 domain-containing protein [Lachnospiraceae bacterium]|nr:DUF3786 domain-containing protein [Lachnospiraceae bacterium]